MGSKEWPIKKIKDVCKVVSGSTPKTSKPEYWGGDILWITPKDLSNFKGVVISDTKRKITKEGYKSCSATLVPKGTVLMSSRAPIGYLVIAGKEICTNQGFKSFICSDELNNRYLYYFLKGIVPELKQKGSGTTFNELSKSKAEQIEIPIPPLPIQEAIVKKLDAFFKEYDILKEEKRKAQDNHERILQSAIAKLTKDKDVIPDDWVEGKISDFIEILYGKGLPKRDRKGGKIPVYGSNGIVGWHDKAFLEEPTVIIGRKGSVGELNLTKGPSHPIDTTYYIKNKEGCNLDVEFIYFLLKGIDLKSLDRSTAIPGINRNDIYKIKIKIPKTINGQKKLLNEIKNIQKFQEDIVKERENVQKNLDLLPHSVLTKAFQGELTA